MDNSIETLEHQTAPESTRGFFEPPPSDKKVNKKTKILSIIKYLLTRIYSSFLLIEKVRLYLINAALLDLATNIQDLPSNHQHKRIEAINAPGLLPIWYPIFLPLTDVEIILGYKHW